MGCPIRRSPDQGVFAPPRSFSQRITSFIACACQGIHQLPLRHLIVLIANDHRKRIANSCQRIGNPYSLFATYYSLQTSAKIKTSFSRSIRWPAVRPGQSWCAGRVSVSRATAHFSSGVLVQKVCNFLGLRIFLRVPCPKNLRLFRAPEYPGTSKGNPECTPNKSSLHNVIVNRQDQSPAKRFFFKQMIAKANRE